jgi:hypothetical protein
MGLVAAARAGVESGRDISAVESVILQHLGQRPGLGGVAEAHVLVQIVLSNENGFVCLLDLDWLSSISSAVWEAVLLGVEGLKALVDNIDLEFGYLLKFLVACLLQVLEDNEDFLKLVQIED